MASSGTRYASPDPTLPKPWRGLIDGITGYLYFWNPDTNVTQYNRPMGPPPAAPAPVAQPQYREMVCVVHFDGASKGNPGISGAGAVLMTEDGRVISRIREGLGVGTNNVAEYRGLILGLKYAIRHGFKRIKVYGDSQLVCYQVKGTWQVKEENMMELCKEVRKLQENFISFEVNHVGREWNGEADRQANIAVTLASGVISEERGDGF